MNGGRYDAKSDVRYDGKSDGRYEVINALNHFDDNRRCTDREHVENRL